MRHHRAGCLVAILALAVALLAGCQHARPSAGCPSGEVAPIAAGPLPSTSNTPEALWVAGRDGSLRAVDSRTDRVTATVDLGRSKALLMASGGGRLFAYALDRGDVTVVDPVAARVSNHAAVPAARPYAGNRLVFAQRALWIAQPGRLWRISPAGAVSSSPLPADFTPSGLVGDGRWLWLTDGRSLLRADPAAPAHTMPVPLAEGIAQLVPGLYASGVNSPTVRRLDPDTGREVRVIGLDEPVLSLVGTGDNGSATGNCGTLTRLADRHGVRVSDVSQDLPSVAAAGSLWVGDEVKSQVVRLDAATGTVLARTPFAAADPDDPAFVLVATDLKVDFYARVRERTGSCEDENRLRQKIGRLETTLTSKNTELAQLRTDVLELVRTINVLTLENRELRETYGQARPTVVPLHPRSTAPRPPAPPDRG